MIALTLAAMLLVQGKPAPVPVPAPAPQTEVCQLSRADVDARFRQVREITGDAARQLNARLGGPPTVDTVVIYEDPTVSDLLILVGYGNGCLIVSGNGPREMVEAILNGAEI